MAKISAVTLAARDAAKRRDKPAPKRLAPKPVRQASPDAPVQKPAERPTPAFAVPGTRTPGTPTPGSSWALYELYHATHPYQFPDENYQMTPNSHVPPPWSMLGDWVRDMWEDWARLFRANPDVGLRTIRGWSDADPVAFWKTWMAANGIEVVLAPLS